MQETELAEVGHRREVGYYLQVGDFILAIEGDPIRDDQLIGRARPSRRKAVWTHSLLLAAANEINTFVVKGEYVQTAIEEATEPIQAQLEAEADENRYLRDKLKAAEAVIDKLHGFISTVARNANSAENATEKVVGAYQNLL